MQYTVNRGQKGKIDVKVDVSKSGFEQVYDEVLTKLGAEANIAGFRPGKAPKDVVLQHVGSNKILNQTASFLISKHLGEILKREKLTPIDSPKIAVDTLAESSPFSFVASFNQRPEVKVGDWKKIKVKKVAAKEITDADVNQSIKNIFEAWKKQQETRNQKQETDGGQITEGTEKTEGTESKGKFIYDARGNRIPIKDTPAQPTPGVSEDAAGHTPGVKLSPDDDFARAIGARDLAHLRGLVKKDLETIVADQVEAKLEQELFEKILAMATIEVPDVLGEDELNRILVRLSTELEKQGSNLEKYISEQKTSIDELKAKWRPQAEKNVKITLIMDEVGRAEGVKVSKDEVDAALKGVSETNLSPDQKADLERYFALSIFQAKTLDLVKKAVAA